MKSAALFLCLLAICFGQADSAYMEVIRISGNDECKESHEFKVSPHWRVTATCAKVGPSPEITVFANPTSGTQNWEIISLSGEGSKSCYVRDGGKYKLMINGFDAAWTVTVENAQ